MIQTQEMTVRTQRVPSSPNTREHPPPPPDRARDGQQATEKRHGCSQNKAQALQIWASGSKPAHLETGTLSPFHAPACRTRRTWSRDRVPNARTAERSETHGAAETLTQACDSVQTGGGRKTSSGKGGDPGHKAPSSMRHFFRVQTQQHLFGAKKKATPWQGPRRWGAVRPSSEIRFTHEKERNADTH